MKSVTRCNHARRDEFPDDLTQQIIEAVFVSLLWKFYKPVKSRVELLKLVPTTSIFPKAAEKDFSD